MATAELMGAQMGIDPAGETTDVLKAAEKSLGSNKTLTARQGSISMRAEDLAWLRRAHDTFQEQFADEIEIIKKRTDERK